MCLLLIVGAHALFAPFVLWLQKNKPPPSEEELEAQEKLFREQREEEYAAIRAQNAIKRKEDDIKLVEASTASLGDCCSLVDGRSQMPMYYRVNNLKNISATRCAIGFGRYRAFWRQVLLLLFRK